VGRDGIEPGDELGRGFRHLRHVRHGAPPGLRYRAPWPTLVAMTEGRMRVGVVLPIGEDDAGGGIADYPTTRDVAVAADAGGFDSVWVFDHLLFRFDGETTGIHECWTVLAAVAAATSKVELGTIVMCNGFRGPALLAKMAATLDHISGGRLILGIGSGWHDPEDEAVGYPTDHKVGRLEAALTTLPGRN